MKTLVEIFSEIGHFGEDIGCNDKGGTHTYLETYDRLFTPFRNGCTFMEIGLAMGDSLKLWDEYFERHYTYTRDTAIWGIDISVVFASPKYKCDVIIIEGDATNADFINSLNLRLPYFDIIIDDASHMEADQIKTFQLLSPYMNPGGIYIIEDILALDQNRNRFEALHDNCEIVDMRSNGRFDNVLIIYRF